MERECIKQWRHHTIYRDVTRFATGLHYADSWRAFHVLDFLDIRIGWRLSWLRIEQGGCSICSNHSMISLICVSCVTQLIYGDCGGIYVFQNVLHKLLCLEPSTGSWGPVMRVVINRPFFFLVLRIFPENANLKMWRVLLSCFMRLQGSSIRSNRQNQPRAWRASAWSCCWRYPDS